MGRVGANVAFGAGAAVALLTALVLTGVFPARLFGGDFANVALLGLTVAVFCLLAAVMSLRSDRRRAWLGLVLALVPVALLGYFLAFTVD